MSTFLPTAMSRQPSDEESPGRGSARLDMYELFEEKWTCVSCKADTALDDTNIVIKRKEGTKFKDVRRCKQCDRVISALKRKMRGNEDMASEFANMEKPEKDAMIQELHDKLGKEFQMFVETAMENPARKHRMCVARGTGVYRDETELREKYLPDREEQFNNIIEHAPRQTHPTRGCIMWEDIELSTTDVTAAEEVETEHLEASTQRKRKRELEAKPRGK